MTSTGNKLLVAVLVEVRSTYDVSWHVWRGERMHVMSSMLVSRTCVQDVSSRSVC